MRELKSLIKNITPIEVIGDLRCKISALHYDSRRVEHGDLFFAIEGEVVDGHDYIGRAIESGAVAIICHRMPAQTTDKVCYIQVEDTNIAMGQIASAFYGEPSRELKLVGITGTNGKTTTATLLHDLFVALGYKVGLISTVVYKIAGKTIESTHTTPDAIRLAEMMRRMVDEGCEFCFMEVSSHAIAQHRIEGLEFDGAIFSNITHDHLDYHKTFSEYIKVKKRLFDSLGKGAFALTNIDDRNGRIMVQNCNGEVVTYSLRSMANFKAKVVEIHFDGMLLRIDGEELWVKLIGRFNAYNLLAVYATAIKLGVDKQEILVALSSLHTVSGRFEYMTAPNGTTIIVDYAHTPDALESVLTTIEEIRRPSQDLYVVCGCGGGRDHQKRPVMAAIATKYASTAIFTSDNPRQENPEEILQDMIKGINGGVVGSPSRYLTITNRAEAIRAAVMMSKANDIILIAGKGHETYQIIGDQRFHFDDREVALEAIRQFISK